MPSDRFPVPGGSPQHEEEDQKTEEADGPVAAGVVLTLLTDECSNDDDDDGEKCCGREAELFGDQRNDSAGGIVPHKMHWLSDYRNRHMEEEDTEGDA